MKGDSDDRRDVFSAPAVRVVNVRPARGQWKPLLEILRSSVPRINLSYGALRVLGLAKETEEMVIVSFWTDQADIARMRASEDYKQMFAAIKAGSSSISDSVYTAVVDATPLPSPTLEH